MHMEPPPCINETNLNHRERKKRSREVEDDDSHGNGANGLDGGSPESPCLNNNSNNNNKEQDRFLPIANVGRIMKKVLPGNGKISKDAKETVQECVSEFISFVTGEASDKCQREKRKTINGDDVIWAITTLGFEDYVNPLKVYLTKYREIEGERLNVPKQQQRLEQRQQQHHHHQLQPQQEQEQNIMPYYAAASLMSHPPPPYMPPDHTYSMPFPTNSIPRQLHPQEQIDSAGRW